MILFCKPSQVHVLPPATPLRGILKELSNQEAEAVFPVCNTDCCWYYFPDLMNFYLSMLALVSVSHLESVKIFQCEIEISVSLASCFT